MTEDRINFDRAKFNAIIAKHGYKQQQIDRIRGKQKWVSNKLKEDRGFFKEDLDWLQDLNNAMYQELMNTAIKTMTRERERGKTTFLLHQRRSGRCTFRLLGGGPEYA